MSIYIGLYFGIYIGTGRIFFIYVCYQCLDKSVGKPGVGVNPADTYLINACTKIILSQHFIMTIFLV